MNNPFSVQKLIDVLRKLRSPNGCPWDRKQTHQSLIPYAIEECAEFMDAAEANDSSGMKEELGDMLMHIVLHSVIAEEHGEFTFEEIVEGITQKMIRRHPHVFGDIPALESADEVPGLWEKVKAQEKADQPEGSVLDGIPRHYPALLKAHKICLKAAKYGFDWPDVKGVRAKLEEEWGELQEALDESDEEHTDEELGDMLFVLSSLARVRGRANAEVLLGQTVDKFKKRFAYIEKKLPELGETLDSATLDDMQSLWDEAKRQ